MPIIQTGDMSPGDFHGDELLQIYCGLDCALTLEVHHELDKILAHHPECSQIYQFERALQGPVLEMMLRGWRINESGRYEAIEVLRTKLDRLQLVLNRLAYVWWGKGLNPRSTTQMRDFFYSALRLPEQWKSVKGERKLSLDRDTLEKLQVYFHAMPIIQCVLDYRDLSKQLETLLTEVDRDGRMRTSFNIAGTTTGRWSSSGNAFGTGGNLQNLSPDLRYIFTADPGYVLFAADLEQAESRECGWRFGTLFGDWTYFDKVTNDDIHTYAAMLVWPHLGWAKSPAENRKVAEQPFYRHFKYRDLSKRGGHLTNYVGGAFTAARSLKVPIGLMTSFQKAYLEAFPMFPKWWQWVAQQIQTKHQLTSNMGRTRTFYGRPNDEATLREAVAFDPQSSTAERTNLWLLKVWMELGTEVQILHQNHDAIYWQVKETQDIGALATRATDLLASIKLYDKKSSRSFSVPCDLKYGWNWGYASASNPDGLSKWKGTLDRTRTHLLDHICT